VSKENPVKYYVQAGSFSALPSKAYLSKIKALGLRYTVRHIENYKVLIGAYKNEKDARKALKKVRKDINEGAFITKF
jgi:cell division protein FtsN